MDMLRALWLSSWLLAAAALIWMILLIGARVLRDLGHARRTRVYDVVMAGYLKLMRDEMGEGYDALSPYRRQGRILAEALLECIDVVRGSHRDRLIEGLQAFNLDRVLRARAMRGGAAARVAAIEALAVFPSAENEAVVRKVGKTQGGEVRMASIKALTAMGARIDLDRLIDDMKKKKEPWSGSMGDALKLLAERQPDDCVRALERADAPASLRCMLAEALGGSGDYKVLPVLCERAMKDEPLVRAAALRALGRLMHPAIEAVVARGIRDDDWQVRGAAANAAGAAGLIPLIPRLVEQMGDKVWWVRFQAAEALSKLGPQGLGALRDTARAGADDAARVASLTLAERGLVA